MSVIISSSGRQYRSDCDGPLYIGFYQYVEVGVLFVRLWDNRFQFEDWHDHDVSFETGFSEV